MLHVTVHNVLVSDCQTDRAASTRPREREGRLLYLKNSKDFNPSNVTLLSDSAVAFITCNIHLYCGLIDSISCQVVEGVDDDTRVVVIETSTGEKLTGDHAPKKGELEEWLKQNPGYEVFENNGNESVSEVSVLVKYRKLLFIT